MLLTPLWPLRTESAAPLILTISPEQLHGAPLSLLPASLLLRVLPPSARTVAGKILFEGEDLLEKTPREMSRIRGKKLSMILQDTMLSLDPVFTVGVQIAETLTRHTRLRGEDHRQRMRDLLSEVRIPEPRLID